jgi:hypothetical protein
VAKAISFKRRDVAGPPDGEAWIWHTITLRASLAWRGKSAELALILEFLELEYLRSAGQENGVLVAPYDDLVQFGLRRAKIRPAIDEGVARKLIVAERRGRDFNTGKRLPTFYRLTYLPSPKVTEGGAVEWHSPTDDWKRYAPAANGTEKQKTGFRRRNLQGSNRGTWSPNTFEQIRQKPSSDGGT